MKEMFIEVPVNFNIIFYGYKNSLAESFETPDNPS